MTINDLLCLGIGMAEDQKTYLLENWLNVDECNIIRIIFCFLWNFIKKQKIIRSVVRFFSLTFKGKKCHSFVERDF